MKSLLIALSSLALFACSSEIEVNYSLSQTVPVEVFKQATYSTYDSTDLERVGTVSKDYFHLNYSQKGDTIVVNRYFEIDNSLGYLKNSHPAELQWRLPLVVTKIVAERAVDTKGFEDFDSLLYRIPMPTVWRNQLLNPDYIKHLERQEKHRFEMDHLLTGTLPEKGNITQLLKDRNRLNFALIQVDSVVADGFHNLDKRQCYGYTVYFREKESFPYYIWEQHVNSGIGAEKFQSYHTGLSAEYNTEFWVTLDPKTGIPCQEREVKSGLHTMVNAKTGDTATFKSSTTIERLFTVVQDTTLAK